MNISPEIRSSSGASRLKISINSAAIPLLFGFGVAGKVPHRVFHLLERKDRLLDLARSYWQFLRVNGPKRRKVEPVSSTAKQHIHPQIQPQTISESAPDPQDSLPPLVPSTQIALSSSTSPKPDGDDEDRMRVAEVMDEEKGRGVWIDVEVNLEQQHVSSSNLFVKTISTNRRRKRIETFSRINIFEDVTDD